MGSYSNLEGTLPWVMIWVTIKEIMPGEMRSSQKNEYQIVSLIWLLKIVKFTENFSMEELRKGS